MLYEVITQCDAADGFTAAEVQAKFQDKVEAIPLPDGYNLKWEGSTARSSEANSALFMFLPLAIGLMAIIIIRITSYNVCYTKLLRFCCAKSLYLNYGQDAKQTYDLEYSYIFHICDIAKAVPVLPREKLNKKQLGKCPLGFAENLFESHGLDT